MSLLRAALLSSCVAFTISAPAASRDPIGDAMLVARQTGAVANDLQNGDCKAMTLIFARGTTEAGNMGSVVGPPFANALIQAAGAGNVAVQGVNNYPADVQGFLAGGDQGGSQEMADLVNQAMTACPTTQVIMSGYSQGGQLVHNAAASLPAVTMQQVSSVVIFGDPDNPDPVAGASAAQTKVICAQGDAICAGQALVLPPHLSYGQNADEAAQFVMQNAAGAAINSDTTKARKEKNQLGAARESNISPHL
ncbi:MAG: hypothetical protein Q9160_008074 [Pyrenula sp. 1 TL-2023]